MNLKPMGMYTYSVNESGFIPDTPKRMEDDCGICIQDMNDGKSNVVGTICTNPHFFHVQCIHTWIKTCLEDRSVEVAKATCPKCRTDITILKTALDSLQRSLTPDKKTSILAAARARLVAGKEILNNLDCNSDSDSGPLQLLDDCIENLRFSFQNGMREEAVALLGEATCKRGLYRLKKQKTSPNSEELDFAIKDFSNSYQRYDNLEARSLRAQALVIKGRRAFEAACPALDNYIDQLNIAHDSLFNALHDGHDSPEVKRILNQVRLREGEYYLEQAKSRPGGYIKEAIKKLRSVCGNEKPKATLLLAEANLIGGRHYLNRARSNPVFLKEAITYLQFAHDNGVKASILLLADARLKQGKVCLEKVKSFPVAFMPAAFIEKAMNNLQFAHDNGKPEASFFLAEAKLIGGRHYLNRARSNPVFLKEAITYLQFAKKHGLAEQAAPLIAKAERLGGGVLAGR